MSSLLSKYIQLLKNLFPKGFAWDWLTDDVLGFIRGKAGEFCRIEEKGEDLLKEFDPRTATELLEDWETLLGLPDECTPPNQIIQDRRALAGLRLASQGGLSKPYLENLILLLGFNSEISDLFPFAVGKSRVGDRLSNNFDRRLRVGTGRVGDQLRITGWRYVFDVNLEPTAVTSFRVGLNTVGDPLRSFGNDLVECNIFKFKQAHTQPLFRFAL